MISGDETSEFRVSYRAMIKSTPERERKIRRGAVTIMKEKVGSIMIEVERLPKNMKTRAVVREEVEIRIAMNLWDGAARIKVIVLVAQVVLALKTRTLKKSIRIMTSRESTGRLTLINSLNNRIHIATES